MSALADRQKLLALCDNCTSHLNPLTLTLSLSFLLPPFPSLTLWWQLILLVVFFFLENGQHWLQLYFDSNWIDGLCFAWPIGMLRVFLFMLFRVVVVVVCLLFDRELCMLDLCRCHSMLPLVQLCCYFVRQKSETEVRGERARESEWNKEATN